MEYCLGNGLELFSASTVFAVCQDSNLFANHAWQNNHSIDFDNACVIDKGNYRVRKAFLICLILVTVLFLHVDLYYTDQLGYSLSICMRDMN